jgi:hypothetical protein
LITSPLSEEPAVTSGNVGRAGLAAFAIVSVCVCLALTIFLISLRLEKALLELAEQRLETLATEISETIDTAYSVGLRLNDISELERKVSEQLLSDNDLLSVTVFDEEGRLFSHKSRSTMAPPALTDALTRRLLSVAVDSKKRLAAPMHTWRVGYVQNYLIQARDEIGKPAALVWATYDVSSNSRVSAVASRALIRQAIWVAAALALVIGLALLWLWHRWIHALDNAYIQINSQPPMSQGNLPGIPLSDALAQMEVIQSQISQLQREIDGNRKV